MTKTTVYLPDDLKRDLARLAAASGRSEADVMREAIRALVSASPRPLPTGALFASGDATLAEWAEQAASRLSW